MKKMESTSLFTIDSVGQTELLDRSTNENNSVKFVRKIDVLSEVETQDSQDVEEPTVVEDDENLSDVDFGGKCNTISINLKRFFE